MLVSHGIDEDGFHWVPQLGYIAVSSDANGQCLSVGDISPNVKRVDYKEDILLSCQKSLVDMAAFQAYCTEGDLYDIAMVQ